MLKKLISILVVVASCLQIVFAQSPYYNKSYYLPGTLTTTDNGLMGLINPANVSFINQAESRFYWTQFNNQSNDYSFGTVTGFKGFNFGVFREQLGKFKVTDYSLSFGGGTDKFSTGIIYGWSSGDRAAMQRKTYSGLGLIWRPNSMLDFGGVYNVTSNSYFQSFIVDAGIRPFKNKSVTIFGGTNFDENDSFKNYKYRYGVKFEPLKGIGIVASMEDDKSFNVGFNISLGLSSINSFAKFNKDNKESHRTHMVRVGGLEKSVLYEKGYSNKTLKMNLKGKIKYKKYKLFDTDSKSFFDIIKTIKNAQNSPQVKVLAISLSGLNVGKENAWEIREALNNFKKTGKKIIIYIDRADMTIYHLASVADLIVLDKEGQLFLSGYAMSRTYYTGTLKKLGIAFDEWRFFKYKSALESYSRTKMSEADSLQRKKFLDDLYLTVKNDISTSRKITPEQFDTIINDDVMLNAELAKEKGMVDFIGRWSKIDKIIEDFIGEKPLPIPAAMVNQYMEIDDVWGEKPEIAVVYALGVCAMDNGINARKLEKQLLKLSKKKSIKAIVLRVDSPGGDALASDLVAEAIKVCQEKGKPVIISQGAVAASGGYWISMYADSIYASPITITASIGVIGGWLYNNGFAEKLGVTSDFVKVGNHADLGHGPVIPLLGAIPSRNLTDQERQKMSSFIISMYKTFVKKVSDGRKQKYEHIEKHAQGRIYSGLDGHKYKLVDKLGGINDAIESAKKVAGLAENKNVKVIEYGKYLGAFAIPSFNPFSGTTKFKFMDPATEYYLTYSLNNPFKPFPMINPETIKIY